MTSIRRVFTHSFTYMLGNLAVMLAGFISFPLWTRLLSVSDYGIFCTVTITITFMSVFMKFGNQQAVVRYYHDYDSDDDKRRMYYTTMILGALLMSAMVTILYIIVVTALSKSILSREWTWYLIIAGIGGLLAAMVGLLLNFFRASQRIKAYNIVRIIIRYGGLGLSVFFVLFLSWGIYGLFIGQIVAYGLTALLLLYLLFKGKTSNFNISYFSFNFLKNAVTYGFPLIWLELSNNILALSDRYIILFFGGARDVALYSAGYNVTQYGLELLYRPLWLAIVPIYLKIHSKEGREDTEKFLSRTLKYYLMAGIPIVFGVSYMGRELLSLLATAKYEGAYVVIPVISLSYLFFGTFSIISAGIHIQKKTYILMYASLFAAAVNIGLNFLLIPAMGIMGAAIATLISYIILISIVGHYAGKFITIKIPTADILKYSVLAALMVLLIRNYTNERPALDIFVKIVLGAVFYAACLLLIDSDLRGIVIRGKNRIMLRFGIIRPKP